MSDRFAIPLFFLLTVSLNLFSQQLSEENSVLLLPADIQLDESDMATDLAEAFTFNKYPTYFQYDTMMHQLASDFPDICRIDTFGYSTMGRLLLALKILKDVK